MMRFLHRTLNMAARQLVEKTIASFEEEELAGDGPLGSLLRATHPVSASPVHDNTSRGFWAYSTTTTSAVMDYPFQVWRIGKHTKQSNTPGFAPLQRERESGT